MLILVPGEVVDSMHVSPVHFGRSVLFSDFVPSVRRILHLSVLERDFFYTASTVKLRQKASFNSGLVIKDGLRELINRFVIVRVVLLRISCLVPHLLSPGIFGGSPGAVALNGNIVCSSANAEETIFSPVFAPGVPNEPVRFSFFNAVSDH